MCALTGIFKLVNNTHFKDVCTSGTKENNKENNFDIVKNIFTTFFIFLYFKNNNSLKSTVENIWGTIIQNVTVSSFKPF